MSHTSIRSASSEAKVSLDGAHVARLSLGGEEVLKPSDDGRQTHGGVAVLIPYAGRIRDGRYTFEGRSFRLPVSPDGHAIHGFAKDAPWMLVSENADSVTLGSRLTGAGYPGVLDARIRYSVRPESFSTECSVTNIGQRSCPFVTGFHPYFLARNWRIVTTGRTYRYTLADRYFPTGERRPFSFADVGPGTSLDDCFSVAGAIRLEAEGRTLVITRRRMPYLIVYNGKHAEGISVAIEPYSGLEDAYNNGIGLTVLRPGESFSCGYKVSLLRP
ncbi:MAG: aldose 1-epimerase [Thaumarchaeota archaeon]|nr:aldose 1-epimerase [Nitrososphaerota archaeon]